DYGRPALEPRTGIDLELHVGILRARTTDSCAAAFRDKPSPRLAAESGYDGSARQAGKAGGGLISRRSSRRTEPRTQLVDAAPYISSNGPRDLQTPADVHSQRNGYPRAPWHCHRCNNAL